MKFEGGHAEHCVLDLFDIQASIVGPYPTIAPPAIVPLHVYLVQIRTCASV